MIPTFPARRSAEELAAVLDEGRTPRSEEVARLSAVASSLRATAPVEPRPDFSADLRARLMTEAASVLRPETAQLLLPRRDPGKRERRLVAAATAFVLVGGTTTVAAAAQSALPGETLYPIKRGLEQAQVTLNTDAAGTGRDLLAQADRRLDEAASLATGDPLEDRPRVAGTLVEFSAAAQEGAALLFESFQETGDPAAIESVRAFTTANIAELTELADAVPADAADDLAAAAVLLRALDERATGLCAGCAAGAPVVEVPGLLLATAEADRALAQSQGRDLTNSHPVVVRQRATDPRPGPAAGTAAGQGAPRGTDPPPPGDADQATEGLDGDAPSVEPELPPLLPDLGAESTRAPRPDGPVEDLTEQLGGAVKTLLPDPEGATGGGSGTGSGDADGSDRDGSNGSGGGTGTDGSGGGSLLDPARDIIDGDGSLLD